MLRREFEVMKKREEKKQAFKTSNRERSSRGGRGRGAGSRRGGRSAGGGVHGRPSNKNEFCWNCFNCNRFRRKRDKSEDVFIYSATSSAQVHGATLATWLLDSGASCYMTDELAGFDEYQVLKAPISITVASGQQKERGPCVFLLEVVKWSS